MLHKRDGEEKEKREGICEIDIYMRIIQIKRMGGNKINKNIIALQLIKREEKKISTSS